LADHLQRDDPVERLMPGLVDHPHPAAAEFGQKFEVAELPGERAAGFLPAVGRRVVRVGGGGGERDGAGQLRELSDRPQLAEFGGEVGVGAGGGLDVRSAAGAELVGQPGDQGGQPVVAVGGGGAHSGPGMSTSKNSASASAARPASSSGYSRSSVIDPHGSRGSIRTVRSSSR